MNIRFRKRATIKIIGFILMIGAMIVLNQQQEELRSKAGKKPIKQTVTNIDHSGLVSGAAAIPTRTEGSLPLRLIFKTNSNLMLVINNCQHVTHVVKYHALQKDFLSFCTRIHYNFITEYLATIRNKDYR